MASVALGRGVRSAGLRATIEDELTLCRALGEVDVRSRSQVYWAARATLVSSPDQLPAFDDVFERFWHGRELIPGSILAEHAESDPRMPSAQHGGESLPHFRREGRSSHLLDGGGTRAMRDVPTSAVEPSMDRDGRRRGVLAAYSPEDVRGGEQPAQYADDELVALRRIARELRARAPQRQSRRRRAGHRGAGLDVPRTVRGALSTDGEPVRLVYTTRSTTPRRVLLLCDVSGSMDRYSRGLLAVLHAIVRSGMKAETYVFATHLTRLTRELRGHDAAAVLEQARRSVGDWSSGTRIGAALAEFNRTYARRGHARGAVVIVISDGWDCGDPVALFREVERLRLQARRLVWVNPRPAEIGGQAIALGMRTVEPLVDDLVCGHDHAALVRLVDLICTLDGRRPARRQRPVVSPVA
jgi:uncharacterized protein with von Willebrand factor type A (vWA) domain